METVALPTELHPFGAGEGNRTLVTSLEGWGFTTKLHPQDLRVISISCDISNVNIKKLTMILYHNPNCSKSRNCLLLLNEVGIKFEVRNYLRTPLTKKEIKLIITKLKDSCISELVRNVKLNFDPINNKDSLIDFLFENPNQLQRPIFFNEKNFYICRPPEKILLVEGVGFEPT